MSGVLQFVFQWSVDLLRNRRQHLLGIRVADRVRGSPFFRELHRERVVYLDLLLELASLRGQHAETLSPNRWRL